MIKLKENKVALVNLKTTIDALDRINRLIETYTSDEKLAVVYTKFGDDEVQLRPSIALDALSAQRKVLVDYLAGLGINAEE